jgi:hypothetical protein
MEKELIVLGLFKYWGKMGSYRVKALNCAIHKLDTRLSIQRLGPFILNVPQRPSSIPKLYTFLIVSGQH